MASPATQLSPADKALKTGRWQGFSILWFLAGMLLILASWIWHGLVIMGLGCLVISLVLEQYRIRKPEQRSPFLNPEARA